MSVKIFYFVVDKTKISKASYQKGVNIRKKKCPSSSSLLQMQLFQLYPLLDSFRTVVFFFRTRDQAST